MMIDLTNTELCCKHCIHEPGEADHKFPCPECEPEQFDRDWTEYQRSHWE